MSDLHAMIEGGSSDNSDSRLIFKNGISEFGQGLLEHLKSLDVTFDLLVCAGDISNRGCVSGFTEGWKFLKSICDELKITNYICVPGNHDHASIKGESFGPKHHLQFVNPQFPFECIEKNTHFWAWNWGVTELDYCNAILLNSSAYHGHDDEYKHGRVATEVVDQIYTYANSESFKEKPFNLLLCHHHPVKMEHVDIAEDNQVMHGGQYLLSKLQGIDKGPWLIIHGHKHFAEINYNGSDGAPHTILSAGSVSARIYQQIEDRTSNQFYILDVDLSETEKTEQLVGTFCTYEWQFSTGWSLSLSPNLPARGGFGNTVKIKDVECEINKLFSEERPFLREEDLSDVYTMVDSYTPKQFGRLVSRLRKNGFELETEHNRIIEIGKKIEA